MSTGTSDPTEVELSRSCQSQEFAFYCDEACPQISGLKFALSHLFKLCGIHYEEVCARRAFRRHLLPRSSLTAPEGTQGAMAEHELRRLFVIRGTVGPVDPSDADDFLDSSEMSKEATTPETEIDFAAFFHQRYHGPAHGWESIELMLRLCEWQSGHFHRYFIVENVLREGHHVALYHLLPRPSLDLDPNKTIEGREP
ncbi:MAG: hypothetical protein Q7R62_01690 [bacterium]|nr:hypothetical protein [bacterium]